MKRTLLVLSLALMLGALALIWLFNGDGSATAPKVVAPQEARSATPGSEGNRSAVLTRSPDEESNAQRTQVKDASDGTRTNALLADATWVDVEVRLPRGTPSDERLELFTVVFAPDRFRDDESVTAALAHYKELADEGVNMFGAGASLDDGPAAEELACEAIGANRFRAPFPKGSKHGCLRLEARYAYLAEAHTVELPSPAITLEPRLGAWFTGRLRLPINLPSDIDPNALDPFEITVNGFTMRGDGEHHGAVAKLDDGLQFQFRGLRPKLTYLLHGNSPQFLTFADMQLSPTAGEHLERQYDLHLGALVSGRVVDERRAGLEGVHLAVKSKGKRELLGGAGHSGGSSDADGGFVLRAIETGKVTITASLEGYVMNAADNLELSDGQRVTNVVIALSRGNTLTGRVVWPDGKPAQGVVVQASERRKKDPHPPWQRSVQLGTTTEADGIFKMSGMTAETVDVRARHEIAQPEEGRSPGDWTVSRDDVPLGVELLLTLEPPEVVRGIVVDDLGAPLSKFSIQDESGGDGVLNTSKTRPFESADGRFELWLAVGKHTLSAAADAHGDSPKRELTIPGAPDSVTFTLPREASIQGLVLDPAGLAVAGAHVDFEDGRGARAGRGDDGEGAKSDAEGRFELKCATPGNVTILATKDGFAPSAPTTVEVLAGQPLAGVQLALRVGGQLEGEIYSASGAPDEGRQIMVGNFASGEALNGNATSDAAGHFVVEHLAPGKYSVMAMPEMDQLAGKDGELDETAIVSTMKMTTVEIVDGEITRIVLGAPPKAPVHLSGRVTRNGEPYNSGVVMAFADGKAMLESMKVGKLDGDGRYALTLDLPGDYTIIVGRQMGDDQSAEFQETIPERPEYELDFAIPLGGIRGRVTTRGGKPIAGIPIALESEGRPSLLSTDMGRNHATDADGRFALENLKPGRYTLRANAAGMEFDSSEKREWGIGVRAGLVVEADRLLDGVQIHLDLPATIEGTVLGADGKPVASAAVFVRDGEGRLFNPTSSCTSDGLGKFTFEGAVPGSCTVSARSGNFASRESAPVRVSESHPATVELRLEPGTTLRVMVEDEEGKPVRASLRVVDDNGRDFGNMQSGDVAEMIFGGGFSSTETRVGPLPGGKYKVTATGSDGTSVTRPVTLSGQEERSVKIRLKD